MQLQMADCSLLADPAVTPVGINSKCGIPFLSAPSHLGNIANVVLCGILFFVVIYLITLAWHHKAAVGVYCILEEHIDIV